MTAQPGNCRIHPELVIRLLTAKAVPFELLPESFQAAVDAYASPVSEAKPA
jgi:hypothetical protein